MITYRYTDDAAADFDEAFRWLWEQFDLAEAEAWALAIESALVEICAAPDAWPRVQSHPMFRIRHVPALRYSVVYQREADVITVIAIAHMRRRPGYWIP